MGTPIFPLCRESSRRDECIGYHLLQCADAGRKDEELYDALNVGLVVGGSIAIPHLRHAVETIDLIRAGQAPPPTSGAHH